ncbi:hypothetical protein [Candidatus Nanohalovita haloferacivicina]|uniref:hypothetical protein n=1 Tax=Candidatus Nanohalovita haloferacivicina TaxID=2978046 RepID=UPI00325F9686|nr:hypothetical protein HBNXNv_0653 [Candidatus Nanohalobia archaeon BNXNv]
MDLDNSVLAYQVFRYTYLDDKSYSVQMELQHDLNDEDAEQVMLKASEQGLLQVVKDSDPEEYKVDFDALIDKFYEYWEEELEELNTPVAFEKFLKGYMKSYLKHEKNSSLREMLIGDLYLGLGNMDSSQGLPPGLEELYFEMSERYEGPKKFRDYVQKGLDQS